MPPAFRGTTQGIQWEQWEVFSSLGFHRHSLGNNESPHNRKGRKPAKDSFHPGGIRLQRDKMTEKNGGIVTGKQVAPVQLTEGGHKEKDSFGK